MHEAVLYIHGKGGNPEEAGQYAGFCGGRDVIGVHYNPNLPWEARKDILCAYEKALSDYAAVYIIANSIGAYFSMLALQGHEVKMALFISPVVDMEGLILNMMRRANVTENELRERGEAPTSFGETLSWEYLSYVRDNRISWDAPTEILYAGGDNLTARQTIEQFAARHGAGLTVMENGEHWFHTEEQLAFLHGWVGDKLGGRDLALGK